MVSISPPQWVEVEQAVKRPYETAPLTLFGCYFMLWQLQSVAANKRSSFFVGELSLILLQPVVSCKYQHQLNLTLSLSKCAQNWNKDRLLQWLTLSSNLSSFPTQKMLVSEENANEAVVILGNVNVKVTNLYQCICTIFTFSYNWKKHNKKLISK